MLFHFSGLRQFWAIALALTLLAGSTCQAGELELSPTEQTWLDAHPVIRMSVDVDYGPYTFFDAKGHLQGVAVEFFADIERLLGVRFEIISNLSWTGYQLKAGHLVISRSYSGVGTAHQSMQFAEIAP